MNRIPYVKKKKEMDKYAICLIAVVAINLAAGNLILLQKTVILIIGAIVFFVIEYLLENRENITWDKVWYVLSEIKRPFYILLLYPVCEEMIYRFMIYCFINEISVNFYVYLLLSAFAFVFVHFFTQKIKCLYKIPFAVLAGVLYWEYKDIMLCICLHMAYNTLAYAYNSIRYKKCR